MAEVPAGTNFGYEVTAEQVAGPNRTGSHNRCARLTVRLDPISCGDDPRRNEDEIPGDGRAGERVNRSISRWAGTPFSRERVTIPGTGSASIAPRPPENQMYIPSALGGFGGAIADDPEGVSRGGEPRA